MQKMVNTFLLTAILLAAACDLSAQQSRLDAVHLKNGKTYEGNILSYKQGGVLLLRQNDGSELELQDADIKKIVQGTSMVLPTQKADKKSAGSNSSILKKRGLYNTTSLSFAFSTDNTNGVSLGAGIGNVTGYLFNHWLGVGVGVGIDNYARRGETVYPIFGELRSYLPAKGSIGIYLAAAGGYGLAFERESLDVVDAEGGIYLHPAIGCRIGTAEGIDVNIDIGFKQQKASFTKRLFDGDVELRNLTYQRLVFRAGLTLWK